MTEKSPLELELRPAFHDLLNILNKITTIQTGPILYMDKFKEAESMSKEALIKEINDVLLKVADIEKTTLEAGQKVAEIKEKVYEALGFTKKAQKG